MATMFLGIGMAPLHGEERPRPAVDQAARADDAVRVGAEFFLNRTETADSVARHFRTMKDHGLTIARIFVIWDDGVLKRKCGDGSWHPPLDGTQHCR
jgi:hypothetical protein